MTEDKLKTICERCAIADICDSRVKAEKADIDLYYCEHFKAMGDKKQ